MIVMTNSEKGGTGKSTVGHVVANYFVENMENNEKPIIIDLDTSNPDIGCVYNGESICQTEAFEVTDDSDREKLQNLIRTVLQETPNRNILINCGARSQKDTDLLKAMMRFAKPTILWVIGKNSDGIDLLTGFIQNVGEVKLCAVANGVWGPEKDFTLFKKYAANVPLVYFPKANPMPIKYLYNRKIPIHHWNPDSEYSDKMPLDHWWESEDWVIKSNMAVKDALEKAKIISEVKEQ